MRPDQTLQAITRLEALRAIRKNIEVKKEAFKAEWPLNIDAEAVKLNSLTKAQRIIDRMKGGSGLGPEIEERLNDHGCVCNGDLIGFPTQRVAVEFKVRFC